MYRNDDSTQGILLNNLYCLGSIFDLIPEADFKIVVYFSHFQSHILRFDLNSLNIEHDTSNKILIAEKRLSVQDIYSE